MQITNNVRTIRGIIMFRLFESVARSCMGKQFNQQGGAEVPSSTASATTASS